VFIALEGGDGSGKSGALAHLGAVLGENVVLTREPGGTDEGLAIRGLLLARGTHDWEPQAELLLIAAARAQHVARVIRPALAAGRVVVSDRYVGSTLAYQGAGRGLDLTLVLDVDPAVALARGMARLRAEGSREDRFEALGLAFQQRVRRSFLDQAAAAPERHAVVDANRPLAAVQADVAAVVRRFLGRG